MLGNFTAEPPAKTPEGSRRQFEHPPQACRDTWGEPVFFLKRLRWRERNLDPTPIGHRRVEDEAGWDNKHRTQFSGLVDSASNDLGENSRRNINGKHVLRKTPLGAE